MAMLAERKRKQKWSLNPRGNLWSKDGNKFGQKMLEKMGWSKGKGLGAKLDGMTEHVKLSHKTDNTGVGFKDKEGWIEHDSNFSKLLQSLATETEQKTTEDSKDVKLTSLETKSKISRKRVHYHKFTRGKDLSRYSEKELANIFGKKSFVEAPKPEEVIVEEESIEQESRDFGVQTHNGGSMLDYFSKKFKSLNTKGANGSGTGSRDGNQSESEGELRTGFGFGYREPETNFTSRSVSTPLEIIVNPETSGGEREDTPIKKKSKKRRLTICEDVILEDVVLESPKKLRKIENSRNEVQIPQKKKKKSLVCEVTNNGIDNPSMDLNCLDKISDETLDNSKLEVKRKKRKKKDEQSFNGIHNLGLDLNGSHEQDVITILDSSIEIVSYEEPKKDKKQKKKKGTNNISDLIENSSMKDGVALDLKTQSLEHQEETKKTKKKKEKNDLCGIENSGFTENGSSSFEIQSFEHPEETKRQKKKKKKDKNNLSGIENSGFNENSVSSLEAESVEYSEENKKKKKRDKKYLSGIENSGFNENCSTSLETENLEHSEQTKKKKKTREKDNLSGIENAGFNGNNLSLESESFEPTKESKKKRKKRENNLSGLENASFNENSSSCIETESMEQTKETKVKKKKKQKNVCGIENSAFKDNGPLPNDTNVSPSNAHITTEATEQITCDLMLNVCTIPVLEKKTELKNHRQKLIQRHRSVRFSSVTEERIIPLDPNQPLMTPDGSHDNRNFDLDKNLLEENVNAMAQTIDQFQAEVENDLNEAKLNQMGAKEIMVGEVGDPHGENELLPSGETKLKLKYAKFGKTPAWLMHKNNQDYAKKSYKHLIKGDIVLGFRNTNLHEIEGYSNT